MVRRIVAYTLILIYSALPWITINNKPAILLDVVQRRFTFFGKTFLPTDTLLLALLLIILFIAVFLITALFGRVWCGWACPQTVYLEFLYRPIEYLLEGAPGKKKPKRFVGFRKVLRILIYLAISLHLAQTFIAYFVGAEQVSHWIWGAPTDHPVAFTIVVVITGLTMFDFTYFREQVCCVVCPYARMQSALLDQDSLIVTYDKNRGEPRGKKRAKKEAGSSDVSLPQVGDCINCTLCVQTCPTGIDIREGLQLECIGCAQCIDACNTVMEKIGRAPNLIKYSSERIINGGKTHIIRPRIVIYPIILLAVSIAFVYLLNTQSGADVLLVREQGALFVNHEDAREISTGVRLRVTNRTDASQSYSAQVISPEGARLSGFEPLGLEPSEKGSRVFRLYAPYDTFVDGISVVDVRVVDAAGDLEIIRQYKISGPMSFPEAGGSP